MLPKVWVTSVLNWFVDSLGQGSANFSYKGPVNTNFKLCGPYGLFHNISTLPLCPKSAHRQTENEWEWLRFNKTLIYKNRQWDRFSP